MDSEAGCERKFAREDRVAFIDDLADSKMSVGWRKFELDDETVKFVDAQAYGEPVGNSQLHQSIRLRLHLHIHVQ